MIIVPDAGLEIHAFTEPDDPTKIGTAYLCRRTGWSNAIRLEQIDQWMCGELEDMGMVQQVAPAPLDGDDVITAELGATIERYRGAQ